jgi:myo-inositol-1-phosphate synthase
LGIIHYDFTLDTLRTGSDQRRPRVGVLFAGLGAISTTLIAGVAAINRGLAKPVGSLALLGTLDVGTQAEPRYVPIKDQIDLARLEDLTFGAWDINETDGYQASVRAGALDSELIETVAPELAAVRAWPGVFDQRFNRRVPGAFHKTGADFMDLVGQVRADIVGFQRDRAVTNCVVLWCGSTEVFLEPSAAHETLDAFEAALRAGDHTVIAPSMVYAYAALSMGVPFVNATPSRTADIPALIELALANSTPTAGKDLKTGQTLIKTILAPGLRDRMLGLRGWYSTNILGNRDGETLDDPDALRTKRESKLAVLDSILRPDVYPDLYKNLSHQVQITYYPPRGDNKESWDAIDLFGWLGYPMQLKIDFLCRDSILAAPLLLDLVLFMDLAKRKGLGGPQEWLSFYFKSPVCLNGHKATHELSVQLAHLKGQLQRFVEDSAPCETSDLLST